MRRTALVDRTITLLVGVVLVASAAAAWAWREGTLISEATLDLSWLRRQLVAEWWPWVMGATGAVLVVLGLVLIVAHLPRRGVAVVRLGGSDGQSAIVESEGLVSAVGVRIKKIDGVRAARGRIRRERHQLVMSFVVTVDPTVSLRRTVSEMDAAAAMAAQMVQRHDLAFRVDLRVARRERQVR